MKPCDHKNMKVMEPVSPFTGSDGFKWCSDCGAFQRLPLHPEHQARHKKLYALRLSKLALQHNKTLKDV